MMGRQVAQGSLFYGFRLDDHVPADHLLRHIDGLLDFGFVREALAPSYSATGRPSVDPELMLRILLVGYLFGIRSERRLCEEVHLNLAYRWFCRLDLGDRVPDHSTFSKNRHGRFRECDLHRLLFEEVVARCAAAGLVAGRELAVDGSTIQADASWEKKLPGATAADELRTCEAVSRPVAEYLAALDAALPPEPDEPARVEPAHVSPTDPQAAFTCKHGPGRFAYAINPLLDLDTDCILDVEATPARFSAEVAATRTLLSRIRTKLGITPASLAADKAYGNGPLLGWLVGQNITPYVPLIDRTRQRDGFFTRDAFRYDRDVDAYRCPADKPLNYMGTVRASQVRRYRSRATDCAACPLKPQCTTARQRAVTRLIDEDARDHVRALAGTDGFTRARRRRKRIERVFGHLKRNLKLRTLKLRGLAGAAEEFTMTAAAYNLQLLAKRAAPA
jgi:transposase